MVNIKVPTSQKCDLCSSEHDHDHGGDNVQVKSDSGPGHLYRLRPAIRTSSSLIRHLGPRTQISPAPSPFTPQTFHPARVNSEYIPNYAAAVSVAAIIYPGTIHSALCISPSLPGIFYLSVGLFLWPSIEMDRRTFTTTSCPDLFNFQPAARRHVYNGEQKYLDTQKIYVN